MKRTFRLFMKGVVRYGIILSAKVCFCSKRFKRWRLVNLTKLCYTEIIIY